MFARIFPSQFVQELAETESYKCSGVVASLERGERLEEVGWLACPLACQGQSSCLPMCCPPDQWFTGSSCQTSTNQSSWIRELEEAGFSFDWSEYSKGFYYCEPEQFKQVRCLVLQA